MYTKLIKIDYDSNMSNQIAEAAALIGQGELVAFPTETVYGLGADAMNKEAAEKIYAAKGRPSDNPLIVHICDLEQVELAAQEISPAARKIMETFWPGPLTVILKKRAAIPDETTGGLSTVALRMPSHPVARALIRESGKMIAAPSANTSGRPSPTKAGHVFEDMKGRIPMVLDGGAVGIGIESTIIDMSQDVPVILRPGYISRDQLMAVTGRVEMDPAVSGKERPENVVAKAPGMKYRHYAPRGRMILVEGEGDKVSDKINDLAFQKEKEGFRVGIIAASETSGRYSFGHVMEIGSREEPETIAARLYDILRECDSRNLDYIFSESFFEEGLGDAIMNRMLKAAAYHLISV